MPATIAYSRVPLMSHAQMMAKAARLLAKIEIQVILKLAIVKSSVVFSETL